MRIASVALLLSACSAATTPDNSALTEATPSPVPAQATALQKELAATPDQAKPGRLKTFGDWAVGCDNTALCTMASLGPERGEFPAVTMTVLRQPGPAGAVDLSFETAEDGEPVRAVAVAVDSQRIALPALNGAVATRVAAAMANGASLTVSEAGDRERARVSLKGASAALRWIDVQQGRERTVTALVAKGTKPASAVPERRPAPVIETVAPTGTAAQSTKTQLAVMRRLAACEDPRLARSDLIKPEAHALGGGATLVMLPCSVGAYNLSSALFVIRGSSVVPAKADAPTGFGPTPAAGEDRLTSVVNGEWRGGELTSYAKGRGLGDCGVRQTLVWDGERLRLSEQSEMGECRGNPHYITTWRAQVVRR